METVIVLAAVAAKPQRRDVSQPCPRETGIATAQAEVGASAVRL